jgi:hypothetical protein
MPTNHAPAIIRWREQLDRQPGGLAAFEQSSTVSTILFGCHRWLDTHAQAASEEERSQIESIVAELEEWMRQRGKIFTL